MTRWLPADTSGLPMGSVTVTAPWPGCDYCGRSEEWHIANFCHPQNRDRTPKPWTPPRPS